MKINDITKTTGIRIVKAKNHDLINSVWLIKNHLAINMFDNILFKKFDKIELEKLKDKQEIEYIVLNVNIDETNHQVIIDNMKYSM